eukprot:scaffold15134_cov101-Isochrysis_galbana.AAC.5
MSAGRSHAIAHRPIIELSRAHSPNLEVLALPREVVRAFGRARGGGWAGGGGGEEAEKSGDRAGRGFGALRAGALASLRGRPRR